MAKIFGTVDIDFAHCKGCNLCVVACPTHTLALKQTEVNDRGYNYAYMAEPDTCIGCAACSLVCPDACIEVYKFIAK